ncbi:hypothetical protein HPB50_008052 [Hyalomma asiaticum]|uniref:Uncharacterized protein n=1 Tax=Hyalomma asiaticum TaxID=266040 RepID=A0ACB7TJ20_HYAAI|nr:hypothetical protein HPB50_008052 [Hyalomma asiaticum]
MVGGLALDKLKLLCACAVPSAVESSYASSWLFDSLVSVHVSRGLGVTVETALPLCRSVVGLEGSPRRPRDNVVAGAARHRRDAPGGGARAACQPACRGPRRIGSPRAGTRRFRPHQSRRPAAADSAFAACRSPAEPIVPVHCEHPTEVRQAVAARPGEQGEQAAYTQRSALIAVRKRGGAASIARPLEIRLA